MSRLCAPSHNALREPYPNVDIYLTDKNLKLNSGSIIFTYQDRIIDHMRKFFSSYQVNFMISEKTFLIETRGNVWGCSWIIEQVVYGIFFRDIILHEDRCKRIPGNIVTLEIVGPNVKGASPPTSPFRSIPHIIHFLPRNKIPFYEYFLSRLKATLKNEKRKIS
jgi:hypothetical protein